MKGTLAVCERDVRKFIRQPFVMAAALLAPFLMLVLLGNAYGGSITNVPVVAVRLSQGSYSTAFLDSIILSETIQLTYISNLDAADHLLQQGKVKGILLIPSDFDRILSNNNPAIITVKLDNTDPLSASSVANELTIASQQFSSQVQAFTGQDANLSIDISNFYRKVEYIEFMAPGSIVQSIFIASLIGGGVSILFDKQRGIIEGYLVTPLKRYEIILGLLFAGVIKAMLSSLTMLFFAIAIAGVRPMTDITGFLLMLLTIFLTGLGLISMMTALAIRAPALEVYQFTAFPINLVLFFTSGAIYPIEGFPPWMKNIALVNPESYAVHALRFLMYKGATFSAIKNDFLFLTVFTVIMVGIAIVTFKRAL